jgi:Subtilase family
MEGRPKWEVFSSRLAHRLANKPSRHLFRPGSFTERLTNHRRVGYYHYPDPDNTCPALIAFVIDQLLVAGDLLTDDLANQTFQSELNSLAHPTGITVFGAKEHFDSSRDVHVWQLNSVTGLHTHADVPEAVWQLRSFLPDNESGTSDGKVAPNHILVPASHPHECPWGPPEEHGPVSLPPQMKKPSVDVVVIDSGYLPFGPIVSRLAGVTYGEWLSPALSFTGVPEWRWEPGEEAPAGVADPRDQNTDGLLDAVAGHANFVAGVVAQGCPEARISVESFDATFIDDDGVDNPSFVTEAAVARAIWDHRAAPVINVGYAFPTLPSGPITAEEIESGELGGPPSWTLQAVLEGFDQRSHYIVAPAGNHSCCVPEYPAAFWPTFPNVVGVGSVDASDDRSTFSDFGPWVRCCTYGENVASTFIDGWVCKPTEEPEPDGTPGAGTRPPKTFEGWAAWSGTSFAAPKVAAALAKRHAAGQSLPDAWDSVEQEGTVRAALRMGVLLDDLPPTGAP